MGKVVPAAEDTVELESEFGNAEKAEWVALMCVIAERDRDLYRQLRAEAWESVFRSGLCSRNSN